MGLRELPMQGGTPDSYLGRECVRFGDAAPVLVRQSAVTTTDGTIEMDLCVTGERSFPGVAWRVRDDEYESFFIRPHQVGNPDSVQYTPVFNGVSSWQLYHGSGFGASVAFPINRWFTLRVSFESDRGEAFVGDMSSPALVFGRLRTAVADGGVGILPGGAGVYVGRFAVELSKPRLIGPTPGREELDSGVVPGWWVSNLVHEGSPPATARKWTYLPCEPTGLANLARVNPYGMNLNTVFARAVVRAERAGVRALDLGFSDRAVLYLNGRPLFAGRDDYRSRDYRFLGSIGYWDTIFLPLEAGDNELVVAVSETLGGWGLKARFNDFSGLTFETR